MSRTPSAASVLARIRSDRPGPPAYQRCDMCGEPTAQEHQHVVDLRGRSLLCTCRPCYLLFTDPDADLAYRAVPDRYLALPSLSRPVWEELELPVGVAFLFVSSTTGRAAAFYPGPAGATESELPLSAWTLVSSSVPELAGLRDDVEALLVRATGSTVEAYVVPIDACYELVGGLRARWTGFDGGQESRDHLAEFFDRVQRLSGTGGAP